MRGRGGFIGANVTPAASAINSAASGVWTLREAESLKRAGTWPIAATQVLVSYLVVAGGGGGSSNAEGGGGGGAGGLLQGIKTILPANVYTIRVGKGGAVNANGQNSVFDDITSIGGGGPDAVGGSGGGASRYWEDPPGPAGISGQGNYGGMPGSYSGGGGGGAGSAGNLGSYQGSGTGGNGIASDITGARVIYAGGGAGGNQYGALAGGSGGGGASGYSGAADTGGGGGGADSYENRGAGQGGSGVVILAVPGNVSATVTGFTLGTTYTRDTSTRAGYTVFRFIYGGSSDQLTGTVTF